MSELNFNHLRYFWAVAHDGNLTRTAKTLNLSQSALSVQIRKLEDRLGHSLFERRGRQLKLTEAGRITLDHADSIFAIGSELIGTLRQSGQARQVLRIGALATLSRNFQLNFLRPILMRRDVEVILRAGGVGELMQGLETLNLDVVLVNRAPMRDDITPFTSYALAEQRVSLVGLPAHFQAEPNLSALLSKYPVILPTRDSGTRAAIDSLVARLGISLNIAAEVDDMAMMRLLAREGIGLAILPPVAVRDELDSGLLIEFDQLPDIVEKFYAVTIERRFPNPLVKLLLES
jgi:LysR family transcriptional activator of nhaA